MTTDPNGTLAGWLLAFVGGSVLIGKPVEFEHIPIVMDVPPVGEIIRHVPIPPLRLSPFYVIHRDPLMVGPGQYQLQHSAGPPLMLASFDTVDLTPGTVTKSVDELSPEDRGALANLVKQAEGTAMQIRASQAGIELAGAGALPPMPGGIKRG